MAREVQDSLVEAGITPSSADELADMLLAKVGSSIVVGRNQEAYGLATAGTPGTTVTGTAATASYSAPCEFLGIEVSAYNGGPQTVVVRNSVDNTGPIVATFTVNGVGFYSYSGAWNAPGNGQNLSRSMSAGVNLTISGGTSRSITAIVSPV